MNKYTEGLLEKGKIFHLHSSGAVRGRVDITNGHEMTGIHKKTILEKAAVSQALRYHGTLCGCVVLCEQVLQAPIIPAFRR